MTAYYNEMNEEAAEWLKQLIVEGMIPPGYVDTRSIDDVKPEELTSFTQCHFFAGIGGWAYALRRAGWPDNRPVWTGSCPCQPFSAAGEGRGASDPRHLWPSFRWLIQQCMPTTVFGEQVASPAGRSWLGGVFTDLERMGYAAAGADLCAAGVNAPHARQRLFWVADTLSRGSEEGATKSLEWEEGEPEVSLYDCRRAGYWNDSTRVRCPEGKTRRIKPGLSPLVDGVPGRVGLLRGYGNAIVPQIAAEFIGAYNEATV